MLKFIRRAFVLLAIVLALFVFGARAWFARSLPQVDGSITLAGSGLQHPVDILRDAYGVPHIYAKTDADMMFALGYVHAQDRFYQMEFQRRAASGQLSAMWGRGGEEEKVLTGDRFVRTMGFAKDARDLWEDPSQLSDQARADLSAYATGVNAFLAEGNALPAEFTIAGLVGGSGELLGPWTEVDSLSWLKIMSLDLGANFRRELSRLHMAHLMEEDKITEFFANYSDEVPFVLPDLNALYGLPAPNGTVAASLSDLIVDVPFEEMPSPAETLGSNNWVIDGDLMASGNSVLSNDPHLGLSVPAVWYFAHISSEESGTNAIGATFPGYPAVLIGRNDHIAWGFTNTGPDVQDLFVERINTATGEVQTPRGWEPLETHTEFIEIAGEDEPVELIVRESRHGPLLSDIIDVPVVFPADGDHDYAFALQWTSTSDQIQDTSPNAGALMFRAKSYDEFVDATEDYVAPQQSMVVLENKTGLIGYIAPGKIPVRHPDNEIQGWAPSPGWDALYDWQGFIPHPELPQRDAPDEGYIITANADITDRDYPHFITRDWSLPLRGDRIWDTTIGLDRPLTMADMEAALHDQRVNSAAQVLPTMLAAIDPFALPDAEQTLVREMVSVLEVWGREQDYSGDSDLVAPTLFFAWYRDFVFDAVSDDLGIEMTEENAELSMFARLFRFNPNFAEDLADGSATGWCEADGCGEHLARALVSAHGKLSEALGGNMESWTWGKLHYASSKHRVLGDQIPGPQSLIKALTGLQFVIDRPHGGGPYSVNVSGFPMNETLEFAADHTPSLRLLVEAGRFEDARFVHTQGQSGLPQSPHFSDMADLWAAGEFAPMVMDRALVEGISNNRLTLLPE